MSDKPTIAEQADAVELSYLSLRDHVAGLRDLVNKGKRPAHDLAVAERRLAGLKAAAPTMQWLALNEEDIKAALARSA